ncbi:MAG: hypothetical protein GX434_12405 [Peptococcaceae bacterium]|nr:hypothetical protein [Peptococcaceae bacterium]
MITNYKNGKKVLALAEEKAKSFVSPEETGGVLFYLVGSKTDELLNEKETIEKMGLQDVDRDDLYIETTILHMFVVIKQYTGWEKDEVRYTKALDQMHFLLFHQLKEYSNYDEDDIEALHEHIFKRYDRYGDVIEQNYDSNWLTTIVECFLDDLKDEDEEKESAIVLMSKHIDRFYKSIPNILNSL